MAEQTSGLGLGQLLLALDRTMVTLVEAPRGLDMPVGSVALVDADDVRLGLAVGPGSADLFFLLGVSDAEAVRWIGQQAGRVPAAIFVKEPSAAAVKRAVALGIAVVAVEPQARWELLYKLVNHAFEHHGDRGDPLYDSGTDLFGLAQSIADRTRGMISIEDEDVPRAGLLGVQRRGRRTASPDDPRARRAARTPGVDRPVGHLRRVARQRRRRPRRRAPGVGSATAPRGRHPSARRPMRAAGPVSPERSGCSRDRRRWPTTSRTSCAAERCWRRASCRGWRPRRRRTRCEYRNCSASVRRSTDVGAIARELGIVADGRAALIGFVGVETSVPADVIALSASAFRADAQIASTGERVYVLLPKTGGSSSVTSWVRGVVAALRRELGLTLRAVIATPLAGLAGAAAARAEVDRVFDSAERHPGAIGQVSSLDEARTTVLLDEIVSQVAGQPRLVDPRVRQLRDQEPMLAETLQAYLDGFGDIAAVAQRLHVHPNTVRYRVRRIEKLLSTSLDDPDDRLVLALGLRATAR